VHKVPDIQGENLNAVLTQRCKGNRRGRGRGIRRDGCVVEEQKTTAVLLQTVALR
jgi:hypothetical protein